MFDRLMGGPKSGARGTRATVRSGINFGTSRAAGAAYLFGRFLGNAGSQPHRALRPTARAGRPSIELRAFECAFALSVLLMTLPLLLIIAILIKLDSPGPALFFQYRAGRDSRPFRFVKFRTMYVDARERFPELYAYKFEEVDTVNFKIPDDPRRTPIGRILRRTTIDEIPNFWNVLTGDMALVGPRPEILEMLPYYKGEDLLKFKVRPGVTGFAQTYGRGNLSFRETVDLDVAYVKTRSLTLDVAVIVRTVKMVFAGHGAF